mmetsp:Transcript_32118/g.70316  ORF Transcript_32118/g.70316 Transcript_32118/m.70316 type:complete len:256 (+) Transcript_32118:267-1034(+)
MLCHVELVSLPLCCKLVPRNKPNVNAKDGPSQRKQRNGVPQVQADWYPAQFVPLHDKLEDQGEVRNRSDDGNGHEAGAHEHELSMVEQPYAVGHPSAVVVVPPNRSFVLPRLMRPSWQRRLDALHGLDVLQRICVSTSHLARVAEGAIQHANHCSHVKRHEENSEPDLSDWIPIEDLPNQGNLHEHHGQSSQHRREHEHDGQKRSDVQAADFGFGIRSTTLSPALVGVAVLFDALILALSRLGRMVDRWRRRVSR